jgi:putative hydrolase of the HAD superfamily
MRPNRFLPATVRAIFFDAVGTLIYPDPPAAEVYVRVGRSFGSRLERAAIATRFSAAFRRQEELDREKGWHTSEAREVERWRAIVGEVLDDVPDPEACFDVLYAYFHQPGAWRCEPDAGTTLAALDASGSVLGTASNFDHRLQGVVAGLPALRPLRHIVVSSLVGWRKPAPEFFRGLGEVTGLPLEQILYVGDDRENDFAGALAVGMHALLLDPRGKEGVPEDARLNRLADLISQ